MRQTYLDDDESRDWLLDVHCASLTPAQRQRIRASKSAFVIHGNEDAPERIDIYASNEPLYSDATLFILRQNDEGVLGLRP